MSKAAAQAKKNEGNTFFKNKNFPQAIEKYTEAISLDPSDVTFYSNRSACHAALNQWQEAHDDGRQCVMTDKTFVKGYYRAALACQSMGNLDGALDFIKRGLGIDSGNADLKKMSKEIEDSQRVSKLESMTSTAESQLKDGDIYGAFKTLDAALRLDPTSSKLNALNDKVRPLYEKAEKQRVSKLDNKEKLKDDADNLFKAAKFEDAIKVYSKCIDSSTNKSSELALKCYNNRAACYKQISNFDGTIEDSTTVLQHKPDDVKALMRRAQAYEACERYKSALQDVRQVIQYGSDAVGKATFDLANGMQHRLNRVISQLKNN